MAIKIIDKFLKLPPTEVFDKSAFFYEEAG